MAVVSILVTALVAIVTLALTYVVYMSRHFRVFRKLGIPHLTPWPGVGNVALILRDGFVKFHRRLYFDRYKDEKVYGIFEPGRPVMVIRDLDMIRDICIKNFNSFVDRKPIADDEPLKSMLTVIKGQQWRRVRHTLSPTFSSGKLKHLYPHIERCARILVDNLKEAHEKDEEVELKNVISCYTMDVIASTGFGVQANSLKDKDSPFATEASRLMNSSGHLLAIGFLMPFMMKIFAKLGVGFFSSKAITFFSDFVDSALANRHQEMTSHKHQDFLQLLVDADRASSHSANGQTVSDKGKEQVETKHLTRQEIQGQALIFILAGYDTVATTLSFCMYLLAQNPECYKKLQEELDRVLDGKFPNYDTAQELTYLDMCLNEAMRMFPPGFMIDRMCSEECVIQGIRIPKGMVTLFPVMCIHNDPAIWHEPDRFDPERFNASNKTSRHPFAHLPFGQGPRNCIGMRLALLEMKIVIAALLQEMTLVPCEKSVYPVKLDPYRMKAMDGLWVKVVPRERVSS